MFADSFCDSHWTNRSHRGWTILASFGLQALAVGGLFVLPLIYTQGLPQVHSLVSLAAPVRPPAPPAPATHAPSAAPATSNMTSDGRVIAPSSVPHGVKPFNETTAPPPVDVRALAVRDGTGDPQGSNPLFGSVGSAMSAIAPPPVAHRPPTSVMMEGNLIHSVQPQYPPLAIQARIQGAVVLRAVISREGTIENLQLISGHPILVRAAMDAVRRWRYHPYSLNREPVEVETLVTVNFVLSER